jgi:hypothetical protein
MKRNEILGEHKKGIKAVKYNKKPQDPAAEHAKAKEKLKPIKPMEGRFDRRDAYQRDYDSSVSGFGGRRNPAEDESNLLYIYKNGRVHQSMISNYNEREARAQGFRDTPEQALRVHGIIQSKFKPGKWVQKHGTQWVEVHPFGKADEPEMDEAMGDPVGTVSSATPDGKVSIKTSTGDEIQTSKDALIPGANGTLQMKPDAAGGALKPGAKVVSTAEDMNAPTTDSSSPINGDEENPDLRVEGDEPTTRRIVPGQETPPGINRLTGKPIEEPSAPASTAPAGPSLSSRYGPGYEGAPAAYTITVSGKDYKFAGRDKTGPGTGSIIKVPGGAVGIRGLAPVSVEVCDDGMFYLAPPTNEAADNELLQKMLSIAGLR